MERTAIHEARGIRGARGAFAARALLPLLAVLALLLASGCKTGEPISVSLEWRPEYAVQQSQGDTCWAASAAMAHHCSGDPASSEAAVLARFHGLGDVSTLDDKSASRLKVMTALVPDLPDVTADLIAQSFELFVIANELSRAGEREASQLILLTMSLQWAELLLLDDWGGVIAGMRDKDAAGKASPALLAIKPEDGSNVGHIVLLTDVTAKSSAFLPELLAMEGEWSLVDWTIESLRYVDPADCSMGEIVGADAIERRVDFVVNSRQAAERLGALAETVRTLKQDPQIAAMLARRSVP